MKKRVGMKRFFESENLFAVLFFFYLLVLPAFSAEYKVLSYSGNIGTMLLALSIVLIWGFCGIFSFGQAAMMGIGGYTYGIVSLAFGEKALTPAAALIAVSIGFIVACILGYFMFYGGINDVYVGLITMCVTLVMETFMAQTAGSQYKIFGVPLGGYNGINNIPRIQFLGYEMNSTAYYYFTFVMLAALYMVVRKIRASNIGFTLLALRENRERSKMLGYNTAFIQMIVFACAGAMSALGGVLYTCWGGYITPSSMSITNGTIPVVLVAAGGKKSPTAALIFALIYLQFSTALAASGTQYALVILGFLMVFIILFVPDGILYSVFGTIDRKVFKKKGCMR